MMAAILTWGALNQIEKNHEFERQVLEQEAQIVLLEQQIENQRLLNQFFATDYYLLLSAKKQQGGVSPGETVYKIDRAQITKDKEDFQRTVFLNSRPDTDMVNFQPDQLVALFSGTTAGRLKLD